MRIGRFVAAGGALVMALASGGCSACRDDRPEAPAGAVPSGDPAIAAVGGRTGRFVGSDTCAPCHQAEWDAWSVGRHRASLRAIEAGQIPLAGVALGGGFAVGADGAVSGPDGSGGTIAASAAYAVGGRHREDLLARLPDGSLQVFPWSFDVDAGAPFEPLAVLAGGASPPPTVVEFWTRGGRNADTSCYGCHATGTRVEVARGADPVDAVPRSRWVEAGIGCEACHGAGGPHVDAARAGRSVPMALAKDASGAERRVAVCASCHGLRETLRSPFELLAAHASGAPIWEHADPLLAIPSNREFRAPFFPDLRPATYQQEAIALGQSACVRRGGLTCESCHDPHSSALTGLASGADGGDAVCFACHADLRGREREHSGHAAGTPGGRCFDCHMPAVLRGPGKTATRDHSLAPPNSRPGEVPAACAACHQGRPEAGRVVASWSERPARGPAARRRLEIRAAFEGADAGSAGAGRALADLAARPDEAWFVRWAALTRLDQLVERTGARVDPTGVRPLLDDPNPAIRRATARVLGRLGDPADRETLAARARDEDPFLAVEAVAALGFVPDPIQRARAAGLAARPDLQTSYRASHLAGRAALAEGDAAAAERALLRALQDYPLHVPALNDLGVVWSALGRVEDARRAWRRALALNPGYEAARRNLE